MAGEVVLDVITWHLYVLGSANSSSVPNEILNATFLNTLAPKLATHSKTAESLAPNAELWVGGG